MRLHRSLLALSALALPLVASAPTAAADGDTVDGRFSGIGYVRAGQVVELDVAGRGGVAGDAEAVSLNITATQTLGAGFATAYPCGVPRPAASSINFGAGATVANGVISKVGSRGRVCLYSQTDAHLIVDVAGFFERGSDFRALTPARVADTRRGAPTVDGAGSGAGLRSAGGVYEVDVTGRGGTHSSASAVVVNLTITEPRAAGYATLYPCGGSRPLASTVNFTAGQTIANTVTARVGDRGSVCVYTSARTHIVVDATGSFPSATEFRSLTPARLLDTRRGQPTVDGRSSGVGRRSGGTVYELDVAGRGGVAGSAAAVSLNLTATEGRAAGFATLFPCGQRRPDASTVNFAPGATVANGVIAKIGDRGRVCIYIHAATHLVVDVDGYFPGGSDYRALTPARLLDSRPDTPVPSDAAAARSLQLLNELRAAHGAGPVTFDATMSAQALAWSQEMSRSGFRHSDLGYAENIAWHSLASMSPDVAATRLHEMWVDSPGHFRNMIDPRWTRVGIGLHLDSSGWYGTHVFR